MADYVDPFELAKLQWRLSRAPAGGVTEDVAVMTFHFINTQAPTVPWADFNLNATIEGFLDTMWAAIKTYFPPWLVSDQYRWYHDGPAYYEINGDGTAYIPKGGNNTFRVTEVNSPGTSAASSNLPPQCATAVTELTGERKHWGRFYLPATELGTSDQYGRLSPPVGSAFMAAIGPFYGSCKAQGLPLVVFSIQKPARPKKNGQILPAQVAEAFEIKSLQIDNVYDTIRRRRWDHATQRFTTPL